MLKRIRKARDAMNDPDGTVESIIDAEIVSSSSVSNTAADGSVLAEKGHASTQLVRRTGSIKDIVDGIRNRDLYQFQRGALKLFSFIPGLKDTSAEVDPTTILAALRRDMEEELVKLQRNYAAVERDQELNLVEIRRTRYLMKKSSLLVPVYRGSQENGTPGRLALIEEQMERNSQRLAELGFDETDPDLVLTDEMIALNEERLGLERYHRRMERRLDNHLARIQIGAGRIDSLLALDKSTDATLRAARKKEAHILARIRDANSHERMIAGQLRLQQRIYSADQRETVLREGYTALVAIASEANRQLMAVMERGTLPTIDPGVVAYAERTAAQLQENMTRHQLESGVNPLGIVENSYRLLELPRSSTTAQIAERYVELSNTIDRSSEEGKRRLTELAQAVEILVPAREDVLRYLPSRSAQEQLSASGRKALKA